MKLSFPLFLVLTCSLFAQTMAPELAPLAQRYRADLATLKEQSGSVLTRLKKSYFDALDAAEKSATTLGQVKAVAAIVEERQNVSGDLELSPVFLTALPSSLRTPRQTYIEGSKRIAAEELERQQRITADYVRNLATLIARAPAGSELARQIAAEKEATLQAAVGTAGGASKIVNGNFTEAAADGTPKGWAYARTDFVFPKDGEAVQPGMNVTVITEANKESFARVTFNKASGMLVQTLVVPPKAREVSFKAHIRGQQAGENSSLRVGGQFFTKAEKFTPTINGPGALRETGKLSPATWRVIEGTAKIPPGAELFVAQFGINRETATGVFDLRRMEVSFR